QRRGWSQRMALDDVTFAECWPDAGAPQQPVSHLSAAGPDQEAVVSGRDSGANRLAVPGSLGLLDTTIDRVMALGTGYQLATGSQSGTLVLAGADHPVVKYGVSSYDPKVTHDVMQAARQGVSLGASAAAAAGLSTEVVDASAAYTGDLVTSDAMSGADADRLVAQGEEIGRRLDGLVCLAEVGIGNTTVAAAMVCAMLELNAHEAVGLGSDADSGMMTRKAHTVERAVARARREHATNLNTHVLAALGGPEIALLAGVTMGAAQRGSPVVLDGLVTSVAALWAARQHSYVQPALVAGQRSR